ncbi:MAG: hypothetical protein U0Q18_28270 [Bryobacteraceae bacterium]
MKKFAFVLVLLSSLATVSALAQAPVVSAVVNGFSFQNKLSPGVLASIFGTNLDGANLTVTLNGINCPVLFSSAGQVNVQIPWEATTGRGRVVLTHDGLGSAPFAVTLNTYSPALAALNGSGSGDGIFFSGPNLITSSNPANGGDSLQVWTIGLGATTPAIATGAVTPPPPPSYTTLATPVLTVGGANQKLILSGLLPGQIGVDQVNFTLGAGTPSGSQNVGLKIAGVPSSNAVTIAVGCRQVNSQVSIGKSALRKITATTYTQTVKITNKTTTDLPAAGSLVLTNLTPTTTLTNGGGASCPSSDGSPFASISFTGSGTSQSATITLHFSDATTGNITYGLRVLSN